MSVRATIEAKLTAALAPARLKITDESHLHAGHAGAGAGAEGETHFRVEIVAEAFRGLSRVQRHRLVYQALAEELAGRVHALALSTHSPAEAG